MATGGTLSTGNTTTGGTPATGGTTSTGGTTGAGCTGSLEAMRSYNGDDLCTATMVPITGPASDAGSLDYEIDTTEVTRGQYESWLATNPTLPAVTDQNCGWKSTGSYAKQCTGYTGADADHHPVGCVDWCDAYAYCRGVGRRLCGKIGEGSVPAASYQDATASQWYWACSCGGLWFSLWQRVRTLLQRR